MLLDTIFYLLHEKVCFVDSLVQKLDFANQFTLFFLVLSQHGSIFLSWIHIQQCKFLSFILNIEVGCRNFLILIGNNRNIILLNINQSFTLRCPQILHLIVFRLNITCKFQILLFQVIQIIYQFSILINSFANLIMLSSYTLLIWLVHLE